MAVGDEPPGPASGSSRSTDKALEEAAASGALNLSGRKLKEFPQSARNHDLSDVTAADLSKNRFPEVPEDACQLISLESLSLYHNCLRSIPPAIVNLQALTHLNISRNQLSALPPYICSLPLKVLVASNNKLTSLPENIGTLSHLRQLDVSSNELQVLPAQMGVLESLRDLNIRRNQITVLPEELAELPLVRLDISCNRITRIPVCYRHLRHLQSILLDNNPLQSPPAQICLKGKIHIFKYLNIEACSKTVPDLPEFERVSRPTGFVNCLTDDFFQVRQYGGLDSGFNSVDSGSKRWSGNESADECSDLSFRIAELARDPKQLKEMRIGAADGDPEQIDYIDSSTNGEEEDDVKSDCGLQMNVPPEVKTKEEKLSPQRSDVGERAAGSSRIPSATSPGRDEITGVREERKITETLQIWQERERQQQQAIRNQAQEKKESLLRLTPRTVASSPQMQTTPTNKTPATSGAFSLCSGPSENGILVQNRLRSQSVDHAAPSSLPQTSPAEPSLPSELNPSQGSSGSLSAQKDTAAVQKPSSFLFRSSSRNSAKSSSGDNPVQGPPETAQTESKSPVRLRSPRNIVDEKALVAQLRKNIELRLNITLADEFGEALSNGAILCQLVNHLCPRAVSFIHVPSPAVPKLNMIKSRKNVENFLEACRKIGVPEVDLCLPSDILQANACSIQRTVNALLQMKDTTPATEPGAPCTFHFAGFGVFYVVVMLLCYVAYCKLSVF
ncbi:leucine-rich repeat and calponin homology domain-containing protein 4 isoform X3 [Pleurodeles waltl]|uniref:leucine-rich repeat and calponin homology domain-containing protein 4 isoform X3 n=1 Tax=Pleurodeles waltl TaxID=8319 RepID=UPI0037096D39